MQNNFNKKMNRIIKNFTRMPIKEKILIYVLVTMIVVLVTCIVVVVVNMVKDSTVSSTTVSSQSEQVESKKDEDYDVEEFEIKEDEYKDTFLQPTTDAGEEYLNNTLFIGDSNTQRLYSFGKLSLQNVLAEVGMGITTVPTYANFHFNGFANPVTIPTAVQMLQPRRIVFNFGTNNANGKMSSNNFIKSYETALTSIETAYQYPDMILATIAPIAKNNDYPDLSIKVIDEYNKAILEFAKEKGYKVLNYNELLKDSKTGYIKGEYVEADGIHLTREAYEALLQYVRTHAYETEDNRPTLSPIPQRKPTPVKEKPDKKIVNVNFGLETYNALNQKVETVVGGIIQSSDGTLTQKIEKGKIANKVSIVVSDGFVFDGWYLNGAKISANYELAYAVPKDMVDDTIYIIARFVEVKKEKVPTIKINQDGIQINVNSSVALSTTLTNVEENVIINWLSSDVSYVTVDANGTVVGVKATDGVVTVSATIIINGKSYTDSKQITVIGETVEKVVVPDFVTTNTTTADGLRIVINKVENNAPEGTVIDQDVLAGTEVEKGTTITLTVSSGPAVVEPTPPTTPPPPPNPDPNPDPDPDPTTPTTPPTPPTPPTTPTPPTPDPTTDPTPDPATP